MNPKEYMVASNDSQLERWMQSSGYYPWGNLPPSEDINEMRRRYEAAGKHGIIVGMRFRISQEEPIGMTL